MTRKWTRPELVIIERTLPGEQVLTQCKFIGGTGTTTPATTTQEGCDMGDPGNCAACQARGSS